MEEEILQFLNNVRTVLRYQQTASIREYPGADDLAAFHAIREQPKTSVAAARTAILGGQISIPETQVDEAETSDQAVLAEIREEVSRCTGCNLAKQRKCSVSGCGGGAGVRLMLIGHWLVESKEGLPPTCAAVFGREEDQMLSRMLDAIHLTSEEVLITNIIKCSVGSTVQPQATHIDACASYLQRQIKAANPELICTMGMVATRALLQLSHPLSRLRGRFYNYVGLDGREIPLLPTFHPAYLLQNPEMKKATWVDLQALEKRIAVK